jgi:hypothetical protein
MEGLASNNMNSSVYIPGVCNIGPAEIAMRKRAGWIALIVTVLIWAALVFFGANHYWLFLLVLPASMSATGFLQAYLHFCAGFGMRGLFNFGLEVGKTETVQQQEFRAKDKKRAQEIFIYSILIGIVVALLAFYL